jgi:signal transduction histidine kinase
VENGRRLEELIDSVMSLARLESQTAELEQHPLDLEEEAREVVELLAPEAEEQGLDLNVMVCENAPVCARVDRAAMTRFPLSALAALLVLIVGSPTCAEVAQGTVASSKGCQPGAASASSRAAR